MTSSYTQTAADAVAALQQWYGADSYARSTGLYHYDDPGNGDIDNGWYYTSTFQTDSGADMYVWWNSANAITALIDYMAVTGDRSYLDVVENTFVAAQTAYKPDVNRTIGATGLGAFGGAVAGSLIAPGIGTVAGLVIGAVLGFLGGSHTSATRNINANFINGHYDDEGWWALAWIAAYDLTDDDRYIDMAVTIFNDMRHAWDDRYCGGGAFWQVGGKEPDDQFPYKNAIVNELFLAVSAGLYRRLALRKRLTHWIYFRGIDDALWLVLDDGSQQKQIGNNTTSSTPCVTLDGWIYFRGTDDRLLKVHFDGDAPTQIGNNTTASAPFVTQDGWVYFRGTDDMLWKVPVDGSTPTQIGNNTTSSTPFVTDDGWVFFQGTDNKLWKVFNDGSLQKQIGNNTTSSSPFVTPDGWIYFRGTDDRLLKVAVDGDAPAQIGSNTTSSSPFVTPGGWIFFRGTDDRLLKVAVDGDVPTQIGDNTTSSTPFVTSDGWVFFQGTDDKLWKVFIDGGQQSQIAGNATAASPFVSPAGPAPYADFLFRANREWSWFKGSKLIDDSTMLVSDSLDTNCRNLNTTDIYSYNQGVILGALCDLAEFNADPDIIATAEGIANALIAQPVVNTGAGPFVSGAMNGILTEFDDVTDPYTGRPPTVISRQFKGIFIRNLAKLCGNARVQTANRETYRAFILANADSLQNQKNGLNQYGGLWSGSAPDGVDFVRQTSAVDLFNAAMAVQPPLPKPGPPLKIA